MILLCDKVAKGEHNFICGGRPAWSLFSEKAVCVSFISCLMMIGLILVSSVYIDLLDYKILCFFFLTAISSYLLSDLQINSYFVIHLFWFWFESWGSTLKVESLFIFKQHSMRLYLICMCFIVKF